MSRTNRDGLAEQVLLDLELGDGDRAWLVDLQSKLAPQLVEIAQRFVDRVTARGGVPGLTSTNQIRRLRGTLVEWMASGLAGPHDEHFCDRRSSLASWHAAAGLSQRHAITAINLVRSEYHDRIDQLYEPREVARERSAQSERIAAMQTLSTGLAHEVRNPLNSAILQLELLERRLRRAAPDPKLIEPVEQATHEIERLSRMLNDFLAFARPSKLMLTDHDVSGIMRDVVAAQQLFAATRQAGLQLAGVDSLRARIDAEKLRMISQNLVRNALEAVASGGHVVVTLDGDDEQVRLAVEDDGPGIPAAIQARIYEPFFTTKETGTGLGLSIVHGIVAAHDGTITFESSPQGTRFEVLLPRRPWLPRSIAT
jgi:signal transduction histidine kinase